MGGDVGIGVAVVTGGASGIGAACARALAREGWAVVVADMADASAVAVEVGGRFVRADVRSEEDWARVAREAGEEWDVLVNAAGVAAGGSVTEESLAGLRRVMGVNFEGVFLGTREAGRVMAARGRGAIVNIASVSGVRAAAGAAAYCASKAAVVMLSRCAALELGPRGVRVNCVLPGAVRTAMWEKQDWFRDRVAAVGPEAAWAELAEGVPLGRVAEAEDVAAVVTQLATSRSAFMTGAEVVVDGGLSTEW